MKQLSLLLGVAAVAAGCDRRTDRESASEPAGVATLDVLYEVGADDPALYNVFSGFVDPAGQAFVAHAGENEVLVFSRSGELARRFGSQGSGPGEFVGLVWIQRFGTDSLLAYDQRAQRATVFDRYGAVGRTIDLPFSREAQSLSYLSVSHAKDLLLGFSSGLDPRRLSGPTQDTLHLIVLDPGTRQQTPIAKVPDRWWLPGRRGDAATMSALPDSGFALVAHDRTERVAIGSSNRSVLDEVTLAAGEPRGSRSIRLDHDRRELRGIAQVVYDGDGNLWIGSSPAEAASVDPWRVIGASGDTEWIVELPRGSRVLDIAHGYVLTRRVEESGYESVTVWRIREASP